MSLLRSLSASLCSGALSFALVTSGCSTAAVGIDDCREIEQARCRAGKHCGIITDVEACERYYRDHCLHGVSGADPSGAQVSECVAVIEAAGNCAAAAESVDVELSACEPAVTEPNADLLLACDVVAYPERATQCAFLLDAPPDDSGAGGSGDGEPDGSAGQPSGGAPAD
jgi:hypothetical protein